jgi:multiphosphoryl transfer protein
MSQKSSTALEFGFVCSLSGGLHARPASHLAEAANEFASECLLRNQRTGLVVSLKSVLAIISADVRKGDHCTVQVNGADEHSAHAALRRYVEQDLPLCELPLASGEKILGNGSVPRVLASTGVNFCFGLPTSPGIGLGRVIVVDSLALPKAKNLASAADPQREMEQISSALATVRARIREKLGGARSPAEAEILEADLAIASDVLLTQKLAECLSKGRSGAEAIVEAGGFFIDLMRRSESEYIRERALDIEEICLQALEIVGDGNLQLEPVELRQPSVVVAEAIAPQQLLALDRRWFSALVLGHSGATSHAVIMARSLGIPTVVGVKNARQLLAPGQEVLVDATRGFIVTQLSPLVERFYERERRTLSKRQELMVASAVEPARTSDGAALEVGANVGSRDELRLAFENGAEGIGLFRTEGIFLGRNRPPSEEEQVQIYSEAARAACGKPVIIRTFDLGGDKTVPYLSLFPEKNSFLGYRGVRIYPEYRDLLLTQLRAILRASAIGNIQVMAPMISSLEEVLQFKTQIAEAQDHLAHNGIAFQREIRTGIMIEVPSAGFILDQLCTEVDFFSLGTNDLNQYFLAADRDNPKTAKLCDVLHPGFLRFLRRMIEEVHAAGKWIGMCGQMASEARYLPLLLGLGLDEISLPAVKIPEVKKMISQLTANECSRLLTQAVACREGNEIEDLLEKEAQRPKSALPLLSEDLILLKSESRNKEEAIQEIVDAFYISGRTGHRQRLEEALWSREAVYSTELGYGFAAPHCKTDAITADSIGVLKLREAVEWSSVDGEPVRMIILITVREQQAPSRHMQVFSKLARRLMNEEFREHLLTIEHAHEMTRFLSRELGT